MPPSSGQTFRVSLYVVLPTHEFDHCIYLNVFDFAVCLLASVIGRTTEWNWSAAKEAVPKVINSAYFCIAE